MIDDKTDEKAEPKPDEPKQPLHPLVAVGIGVVTGLLLARLIRR